MDAKNFEYKNGDKISYGEYLKILNNYNIKCEYRDGKIYFMSPTSLKHKIIIDNTVEIIKNYLKDKKCKVFSENMELYYMIENKEFHVYPDIVIICDFHNFKNGKYYGNPKLIIEVLSSNKDRDTKFKKALYQKIGVEEYIIINQYQESIEIFQLQKDAKKGLVYCLDTIFESNVYKDLFFDLNKIFDFSFYNNIII